MEVNANTKKKQFLIILDIFIACISEEDAKLCFFGGKLLLKLFLTHQLSVGMKLYLKVP
jgi:hypothetical protein